MLLDVDTFSDEQVEESIAAAQHAFTRWRAVELDRRSEILLGVASLLRDRAADLALLASVEMGKPVSSGVKEVMFCAEIFEYFATKGPMFAADQRIPTGSDGTAVVQRRPIGPLLGVMPWNYPYYQIARFVAPNLMLGNTVLLKHAESVPQCARGIEELMIDAGLPRGAYVNLYADHAQVEGVIADPRVRGISVTGSERAGAAVASWAGRHLKKCVLELGGSDAYVVLDTDDVASAASLAWSTRMDNAGQACNSNKRIIVMSDLYDEFVARLVDHANNIRPGDPTLDVPGTYPPLASRSAAEALDAQVRDAVSQGAVLRAGGGLVDATSAFYAPAVLTDVTPSMRAYREELFGPVAVVYRIDSDAEAVALANDSEYGLGGAVFSADVTRAAAVAQQLEVGMANINHPAGLGAELPFGGIKRSGFGRELGPLAMDEFVNKRLVFVADPPSGAC